MNFYDSDRMADLMRPHGYEVVETPEQADMVIVNTCHIREKAAEKVFSELGRIRALKTARRANGGNLIIVVSGCVAQAEGKMIPKRAPYVDVVIGPQAYHRLPQMVEEASRKLEGQGARLVDIDFPLESKFDSLPMPEVKETSSSFLTIQEGCDKFCTYCVVPYTRGAEVSRPVNDVMKEARFLAEQGVREITLLGQNVNAYHGKAASGKEWGLGRLCYEIAEISGIERIRYTTSHPRDMDEELIKAHGDCEKLMPFLHLPVQSGSDHVLKLMNRQHTAQHYLTILEKLREARPDIAFSSDFIVGFAGESDKDFQDTLNLVKAANYAQAYSFKYSPRPGTPGSIMDLQVEEDVKDERLQELQSLLNGQQVAFNESCVGTTLSVLFDRFGKKENQYVGRSPYMQSVHVNASENILGEIVEVKIVSAGPNGLKAELLKGSVAA